MGIMESICQYQWDQAMDNFDFATVKPDILDAIKKLNNSLSDIRVDVDIAAVKYLLQITEADLDNFLDSYASFACVSDPSSTRVVHFRVACLDKCNFWTAEY